jgi:hypothetical protein
MSKHVNFKVMVQGLANTPMRFEVNFVNASDGLAIVTQVLTNLNQYLVRGYNISTENLFVFVNVSSSAESLPRRRHQILFGPNERTATALRP